jgi:hypothetical protein
MCMAALSERRLPRPVSLQPAHIRSALSPLEGCGGSGASRGTTPASRAAQASTRRRMVGIISSRMRGFWHICVPAGDRTQVSQLQGGSSACGPCVRSTRAAYDLCSGRCTCSIAALYVLHCMVCIAALHAALSRTGMFACKTRRLQPVTHRLLGAGQVKSAHVGEIIHAGIGVRPHVHGKVVGHTRRRAGAGRWLQSAVTAAATPRVESLGRGRSQDKVLGRVRNQL